MSHKTLNRRMPNPYEWRLINERDIVELAGRIMADPRVSANAALAAIAILQHVDPDTGWAIVSDKALCLQTASKTDSRRMEFARERLRRTKWLVWTAIDGNGEESKFAYVFPSLGRLQRLQ
ncbi:hypothetical protein [Bradyrhizobium sp. AUGA SZCCT0182]|uniref:hypothetical protein n=1 Tax=Bradyrhizobium sp. AUGA SZCCT0182 TaxID=2807667 RepID=UPI001BA58D56|nr:hypothetical protein [Bradyrhizobium sp. AUGA SZCCT0182]MBR1233667.1 hypothetical protein [Bradyrhizobium sp. AUGA SZCCT0182]